jgi:hypothetical protein
MSTPDIKRIRALELAILHAIETTQQNPAEGYTACWLAFLHMTRLVYGDSVASHIRSVVLVAAGKKELDFLESLLPAGEA